MFKRVYILTLLISGLLGCSKGQQYYNYPIPSYNNYYPPSQRNLPYNPPQQPRYYDNDNGYRAPGAYNPYNNYGRTPTRPLNPYAQPGYNSYYGGYGGYNGYNPNQGYGGYNNYPRDNDSGYYYNYQPSQDNNTNPDINNLDVGR